MAFDRVPGGFAYVDVYADMDEATPQICNRFPLDDGYHTIWLDGLRARFVQFVFKGYGHRTGVVIHGFDLTALAEEGDETMEQLR